MKRVFTCKKAWTPRRLSYFNDNNAMIVDRFVNTLTQWDLKVFWRGEYHSRKQDFRQNRWVRCRHETPCRKTARMQFQESKCCCHYWVRRETRCDKLCCKSTQYSSCDLLCTLDSLATEFDCRFSPRSLEVLRCSCSRSRICHLLLWNLSRSVTNKISVSTDIGNVTFPAWAEMSWQEFGRAL